MEAHSSTVQSQSISWNDLGTVSSETESVHADQGHWSAETCDGMPKWSHSNSECSRTNRQDNVVGCKDADYTSLARTTNNILDRWDPSASDLISLDFYNICPGVNRPAKADPRSESNMYSASVQIARPKPKAYSQCIEAACVTYICGMLNISTTPRENSLQDRLNILKQEYCGQALDTVVADLADIAVGLLGCFANLDAYLYGVVRLISSPTSLPRLTSTTGC